MINTFKQTTSEIYDWTKRKIKKIILIGLGIGVCLAAPNLIPEYPVGEITAPENNTYKIGALNYDSILKENITEDQPLKYQLDDKFIAFKPVAMKWDKIPLRTLQSSSALIDEKKHLYKNAFGKGIDIDMNFGERVWEKVVKINSLENLGKIPKGIKNLEVIYEVETNFIIDGWNKKDDFEITEITRLGDYSYIEPAMAWDSYSEKVCEQVPVYDDTDTIIEEYIEQCETLTNKVKIKSFLSEDKGKLYLTKQIPVEWLKTAQYPIYTDTDVTYGSALEFEAGKTQYIKVFEVDTNKFVVCYMDDVDGDAGKCRAGSVSGTTITYGDSELEFTSDVGIGSDLGACKIDTDKFAVVYADDAQLDDGYSRVGTIDWGTANGQLAYGTAIEFEANGDTEYPSCASYDSLKYIIIYNDETDSDTGKGCACTVSGTTITAGTPTAFDGGTTDHYPTGTDTAKLDTNKFVAVWEGQDAAAGDPAAIVGTVGTGGSERVITFGSVVTLDAQESYHNSMSVCSPDTDKFIATFTYEGTGDDDSYVIAATVSTRTITLGTAVEYDPLYSYIADTTAIDATHFIIAFSNGSDSHKGYSNYSAVDFSDRTIITGTSEYFYNGGLLKYYPDTGIDLIGTDKIVICYSDDDDAQDSGYCIIGDVAGAAPSARRIIIVE